MRARLPASRLERNCAPADLRLAWGSRPGICWRRRRVSPLDRFKDPARMRPSRRAGVVALSDRVPKPRKPARPSSEWKARGSPAGAKAPRPDEAAVVPSQQALCAASDPEARAAGVARDPPGESLAPAAMMAGYLLTPSDVAARLRIETVDPERWVRRLFSQYGLTFTRVRGRLRVTEQQFEQLTKALACSPCAGAGRRKTTTSEARSRSATAVSTSRVQCGDK